MVAFNLATATEMEHIPYRGTGPMMNDLVAGTIDLTLTGGPPALPPVRAGTLRALGVSSFQRLSSAPDIPTIAEQGVPGFEATQWLRLGRARRYAAPDHRAPQRRMRAHPAGREVASAARRRGGGGRDRHAGALPRLYRRRARTLGRVDTPCRHAAGLKGGYP